ncbi:MAG: nucleotide exchange factor GrpE [Oscillospiraceae bacterium]|nr:nucleotide exchange factor GrpE [Oscillospiraceae bacterium]
MKDKKDRKAKAEQAQEPVQEEVQPEEAPEEAPEETAEPSQADALRQELDKEKDKYLRLAAEYDNFRRRSQKERENLFRDVKAETVTKLLPVYDNLERAIAHGTEDAAFLKGVQMTMTQLENIFAELGVEPIEALGRTFDPALHNAVMHVQDEEHTQGEIVQEFQKGFKLGDKVIRFSMVKVAN